MSKTFTRLMATRPLVIVLGLLSLAAPSLATAGAYVGVGLGGSRTESGLKDLDLLPSLSTDLDVIGSNPDFSGTDVSLEVTVGWAFNEHWSVEGGYIDFGEARDTYELPLSPPGCETAPNPDLGCQSREWTATVKTKGWQLFALGSTPLNENVDAYLKLGAISWYADYAGFEKNVDFIPGEPIGPRNPGVSSDDSGVDLAAAMGFNLKTGTPFSVRTELAYYDIANTDLMWVAQLMGIYTF